MGPFLREFDFDEGDRHVYATLKMHAATAYAVQGDTSSCLQRRGSISAENGQEIEIVIVHSPSTAAFIYMHDLVLDRQIMDLIGLRSSSHHLGHVIRAPGQLLVGARRARVTKQGIRDLLASPAARSAIDKEHARQHMVVPVLREGIRYEISDCVYDLHGILSIEVVADAHHRFNADVACYRREVVISGFKDEDMLPEERETIRTVIVGDSIASGIVLIGLIQHLRGRFPNLQRAEIVAPFATVRGLARLAAARMHGIRIRVFAFETLLDALEPDFYYSAHFADENLHLRPDLEAQYREWWGRSASGAEIASTACAGYGWSEAFFVPAKQFRMIDQQLTLRHGCTLADLLRTRLQHRTGP